MCSTGAGWNCIRVADNLAGFLQLLLRSATAKPNDALRQHMALALLASAFCNARSELARLSE